MDGKRRAFDMSGQGFSSQLVAHLLQFTLKPAPSRLKPRLPQSMLYQVSVATVTSHPKEEPETVQVHSAVLQDRSSHVASDLNQSCRKVAFPPESLLSPFQILGRSHVSRLMTPSPLSDELPSPSHTDVSMVTSSAPCNHTVPTWAIRAISFYQTD